MAKVWACQFMEWFGEQGQRDWCDIMGKKEKKGKALKETETVMGRAEPTCCHGKQAEV